MANVLVLGEICLDVILQNPASVPVLGKPVWAENIRMRLGGSATYVAQGFRALGVNTTLNSAVGDDPVIDIYLNQLADQGISLAQIYRQPSTPTPICIGVIDRGKKSFIGCSPFLQYPEHLLTVDPSGYDLLYFGGYLLYPEIWDGKLANLLRAARTNSHTVLDTQMLPIPVDSYRDRALTRETLQYVDVLLVDRKEAIALTKEHEPLDAARILAGYGPKIITIKLGAQGCMVYVNGQIFWSQPPAVAAHDLIGAGDYFGTGFSYGLMMGWPLQKTADFSNAFAALCTARLPGESLPDVNKTLETIQPPLNG